MDTTQTTTHIGLCAGYGGIELGLQRVIPNLRSVALCEIEAFACANLVAKMEAGLLDAAPIWTDLKTFPWAEFRDRVDILTGGYPCQPFSAAGKRAGQDDPRHLWPFIADGIAAMRPRLCFFENVEGHISLGLSDVIEDLAGLGYRTTWGIFSASEVGAPHQRKRVFILAECRSQRGATGATCQHGDAWPTRPGKQQFAWEPPRVVANAAQRDGVDASRIWGALERRSRRRVDSDSGVEGGAMGHTNSTRPQVGPGQRGSAIQRADADGGEDADGQTQPSLGGDTDGFASGLDYAELCVSCDNRTDELRLLGNGVVPAAAEKAFRVLMNELTNQQTP